MNGYAGRVARDLVATVGAAGAPGGWAPPGRALVPERLLPVAGQLAGLFPEHGLRRGSTVVVDRAAPGAMSLALALLSGPSAAGSWCAAVGAPDLGLVGAAQLGLDIARLALAPSPGPRWPVVAAAFLEGFDVVLLVPPGDARPADARRLEARARQAGSVLAVLSPAWPGVADVRLSVDGGSWTGLEDGAGYLAGRELQVALTGRGAASRPRRARLVVGQGPDRGPGVGGRRPGLVVLGGTSPRAGGPGGD